MVRRYGSGGNLNRTGAIARYPCPAGQQVGEFWNQISLIDMEIDETLDMSHAPGYLDGSTTMYVLTLDKDTCPGAAG